MTDFGDGLDECGGYGRRKKAGSQGFSLEQAGGLCYDLWWWRAAQPSHSDEPITVHSTHSLPWLHQEQRGKINLSCGRRRGSVWETEEPRISDRTDWPPWDWFPKDQVDLSAEDSGNQVVELSLPLTEKQTSCCQPFAHPWMLSSCI